MKENERTDHLLTESVPTTEEEKIAPVEDGLIPGLHLRTFCTKERAYALLMGLLTAFFCLFVADGLFGLDYNSEEQFLQYALPGYIIYYVFLLGLPILFRKRMGLLDTWVDLVLYIVLYDILGLAVQALPFRRIRRFLAAGSSMFEIPGEDFWLAVITAINLWALQAVMFMVFMGVEGLKKAWRASREHKGETETTEETTDREAAVTEVAPPPSSDPPPSEHP